MALEHEPHHRIQFSVAHKNYIFFFFGGSVKPIKSGCNRRKLSIFNLVNCYILICWNHNNILEVKFDGKIIEYFFSIFAFYKLQIEIICILFFK